MRIVLSTIGKFHTFDLARQIHRRGDLIAIFSGYPWFKLKDERLPRDKIKTFPYLHAPYMRFAPPSGAVRRLWEWQDKVWFDSHVARHLPACDVFCGLSGSALRTAIKAKSQGAGYICDRGSSHIRFQDRILREEYERQGIPFSGIDPRVIACEEAEYETADLITVPSTFALNTFVDCGVPRQKLRLVPYGVDLSVFHPVGRRNGNEFRVLFAGNSAVRKGVRDLIDAFFQLSCERKRLVFVGSVSPELESALRQWRGNPVISILGHVSQLRLREIMSASDVMVLPSIEEGLACVQAQALACGCPVIATEHTGARDLFTDGREGFIVPIRDPNAIAERLQRLADDPALRSRMSQAALNRVKSIGGWEQYGEGMHEVISGLCGQDGRSRGRNLATSPSIA
jgi:glycosyltransferase involved in cell wall biosynthesis